MFDHLDPQPANPSTPVTPPAGATRVDVEAKPSTDPAAQGFFPAQASIATAAEEPGSVIGNYRLMEKIGEGGFGSVYVAEQKVPVRRRVALKIIKLGMDTRSVVARFEAERQALAMMDHANIAKVFDAGATETGRPYFVMELVRGVPITQYCDENQLPPIERLKLFIQVCHAIQHAHQKGIIHRDIKPSNILVTLIDAAPVPKVIDFGISKATQGDLTEKTVYTQFQQFVGTPAYMSPEQAEMSGLDVDTRSDIYSLGVLLYELLTGVTPFEAEKYAQSGLDEVRRRIREVEPVRPSNRLGAMKEEQSTGTAKRRGMDTNRLMSLLRGDLDWIVMKCLEKDRTRRYETASNVAEDIQRHLSNEPIAARPPSTGYRLRKLIRRNKLAVGAALAVALALVLGVCVSTWEALRATHAMHDAQNAESQADAARLSEASLRQQAEAALLQSQRAEAEGLVAQGDALRLAGRWEEARLQTEQAYSKFVAAKLLPLHADLGLWSQNSLSPPALLTYLGHTGSVNSVAFSRDGRTAISGSDDKTLIQWDVSTGRAIRTFVGHTAPVLCVAISPDGTQILSASSDNTLRLWDIGEGKAIHTFIGHSDQVICVTFCPDGKTAISGSKDNTLKLWDLSTGEVLRTFTGHSSAIVSVAVSPDGKTLISGSHVTARIWDIASGKQTGTFSGQSDWIQSIAFSPDGKSVLSGSYDKTVKLWDPASGKEIHTFLGHTAALRGVAFRPDGKTAVSASDDNTLKLWNLETGEAVYTFAGHKGGALSVAVSPDGLMALSASDDQTLKLWDLVPGRDPRTFNGHSDVVNGLSLSEDGRLALSASDDKTVKLWDMASGQAIRAFTDTDAVKCVAFIPGGQTAISGGSGAALKIWDIASGQAVRTLSGHKGLIFCVAVSPDGHWALSGSKDSTMKLWDIASGTEIRTMVGHKDAVVAAAFSPDGKTALSASNDDTLKLWDLDSGHEIRTFRGHGDSVYCVAFSPDGHTAISGAADKTLRLWDMATGNTIRTFAVPAGTPQSVAVSPDGKLAAAGIEDHTLKIWDIESGRELVSLEGHASDVWGVAFTPDGKAILSAGGDNTLKLWDLSRVQTFRELQSRVVAAQVALRVDPQDPAAMGVLGQWWAFRGLDGWAVQFLEKARAGGTNIPALTLARSYWNLGRFADARREFVAALADSHDSQEQRYLNLCIGAMDAGMNPPATKSAQ